MGFFDSIARFFRRLFGGRSNEPEPEPEPQPKPLEESTDPISRSIATDGREQIHVNLFTTDELAERNGRIPEQMAARYIEQILDDTMYDYKIRYNFETVDVGSEQSVCGEKSAYEPWRDTIHEGSVPVAKDSNILLTDARGGGCGAIGGKIVTAPGREIDELKFYEKNGSGQWYDCMSAILHELGHNLSLPHDNDDDEPGKQHNGTGWNDDEESTWHRTPMNVDNGTMNHCGEDIPRRKYSRAVQELYFHDCAIRHFGVKDD